MYGDCQLQFCIYFGSLQLSLFLKKCFLVQLGSILLIFLFCYVFCSSKLSNEIVYSSKMQSKYFINFTSYAVRSMFRNIECTHNKVIKRPMTKVCEFISHEKTDCQYSCDFFKLRISACHIIQFARHLCSCIIQCKKTFCM